MNYVIRLLFNCIIFCIVKFCIEVFFQTSNVSYVVVVFSIYSLTPLLYPCGEKLGVKYRGRGVLFSLRLIHFFFGAEGPL